MSDELHKAVAFEDCDSYELFSPADRWFLARSLRACSLTPLPSGRSLFSEFSSTLSSAVESERLLMLPFSPPLHARDMMFMRAAV